ncbi:MAG: hypothetical protein IKZ52_09545 [Bacteroidales bacterium]|nr:hypothetical protein [Bacteroidales bacterium]
MIYRITQALKAEKYHLPKVGTYMGAQLAAMLQQQQAPAETVRVFQNFVESVKIDPPRHIIIAPPAQ